MANRITKAFNALTGKNTHAVGLPTVTATSFRPLSSFWDWVIGKSSLKTYIDAYGRNPFVAMVINKIAFSSASIRRIAVDKNDKELTSSKILDLLSKPNKEQTQIEFLELMGKYYESTGNVYVRIIKAVGGLGYELKVLESDKTTIICNSLNDVVSYEYTNHKGMIIPIPEDEILHISEANIVNTDGTDSKYGLSKLHAAMIVIVSSDEKFKADASITKNKGVAGIVSSEKDTPMLPKERQRMQDEYDAEATGTENFGKIKVSSTSLKFLQMGMSPTDLKILEGIIGSLRIICSTYGLSSIIFNDTESSTFNNMQEATKSSFLEVYIPLANKFDDKLSRFLSRHLKVDEKIKVDLTSIEVIDSTTNETAQALNEMNERLSVIAINSLTDDEIRALLNLDALTGNQVTIGQQAIKPATDGTTN